MRKRRSIKRRKHTLAKETHDTIKTLIITLSLMIVALGAVFLIVTNDSAQKGYTLQQEKLENETLKSKNETLKAKITQATAFSEIEETNKVDTMKGIEEKQYVTSEDNKIK